MTSITRRSFTTAALTVAAASSLPLGGTLAQAKPIRIGFSIAQTGSLASGGKAGLLALQIWRDQTNAAGGILGRPVELVGYDDQSNGANTPGIYAKLIDVDKVDLLLSPYGSNVAMPIMPLIARKNRLLFGMLAIGVNESIKSDRFFSMGPWGGETTNIYGAFMELAKEKGLKSIAILASDANYQQIVSDGARKFARENGMTIVLDSKYPVNLVDFTGVLQSLKSKAPDVVFVCSYPGETVAIIQGIEEVGLPGSVQLFGGGMIGLQFASVFESLGGKVNGIVNNLLFPTELSRKSKIATEVMEAFALRAKAEKIDHLGLHNPPFWYATGQVIKAAVEATGGTDDQAIATWLRSNEVDTIVGPIRWDEGGEWIENRVYMVQFQGIGNGNVEQFRDPGKVVIVSPKPYRTGDVKMPFAAARS